MNQKRLIISIGAVFILLTLSLTSVVSINSIEETISQNQNIDLPESKTPFNSMNGDILFVGCSHPDCYDTIQEAIDAASDGDTVYVYNDIYYENVKVNKTIDLIGEDKDTTIIDGTGIKDTVAISANSTNISGFTIQNGGSGYINAGLGVYSANNVISNNIFRNNNRRGIFLRYYSHNTVTGNHVYNNSNRGIHVGDDSYFNIISNNIVENNTGFGIALGHVNNNQVIGNIIKNNNDRGIHLDGSNNNYISGNTVIDNRDHDIRLYQSINNTVTDNILVPNGITIEGESSIDYFDSQTINNNTVNGKPIRYYSEQNNLIVPGDTGQLILANCTDFTIQNLDLSGVHTGLCLGWSSYNIISGNTISDNSYRGMYLYKSSNNTIYDNNINGNGYDGIYIKASPWNNISENTIAYNNDNGVEIRGDLSDFHTVVDNDIHNNSVDGIFINSCTDHTITGNTIADNGDNGIYFKTTSDNIVSDNVMVNNNNHDIYLYKSKYSTFTDNIMGPRGITFYGESLSQWNNHELINNTIDGKPIRYYKHMSDVVVPVDTAQVIMANCTNFTIQNLTLSGIESGMQLASSKNNKIFENTVSNANYGIYLCIYSEHNSIYHNNFINNTEHVRGTSTNTYDLGYPYVGNYWDDYIGIDECHGLNQNLPGGDNVGDTPYILPRGTNIDWYPLMQPWNGTTPVPSHNDLYVDDNNTIGPWDGTPEHPYQTIQNGIDSSSDDYTIYVYNGFYPENIIVDKSIILNGEARQDVTVIDGSNNSNVVEITADDVTLSGFTIQNSGNTSFDTGISVVSDNNIIMMNTVLNNFYGIFLTGTSGNQVFNNYFDNDINVFDDGFNVWNTSYDCSSGSNIIGFSCMGGNFWSDYDGVDMNGDGIGDTELPYTASGRIHNGGDYLPLVDLTGTFLRGDYDGDGTITVSDVLDLLRFLYVCGPPPPCWDAADTNDDGFLRMSDALYVLRWLYIPGYPDPPAPGPYFCGPDPTEDDLECNCYEPCGWCQ